LRGDAPHAAPASGRADLIEPFWLDYQRACAVSVPGFVAAALAATRRDCDSLAELVQAGAKRAHATLRRDFDEAGDPLPQPGDHVVVLDGAGAPRAIVRNRRVELCRFADVDADFASEAGEGDGSLRWWLLAHRQEFAERAEREGFEIDEGEVLVLEYFDCVWPADG